jgi:outer membrane protein assembly factor BamB
VLVASGLVWTGKLVRANEPGITEARNPKTGEVERTRPADQEFFLPGMGHHRCYRNKATERFLLLGRSGVEFLDVATGDAIANHWTRGTCQYGVMPANGLLYVPPHTCACFPTAKLDGFNCFSPKGQSADEVESVEDRLERGPAYEGERVQGSGFNVQDSTPSSLVPGPSSLNPEPRTLNPSDWPTYRHDAARSGRATSAVPAELEEAWQVQLGGKLSSIVVAEGKLLVAQVDAHTVHALDAADGRRLWSYTAGGRVDSPPSVWQGRVLFGSADGWVYCLRAEDGDLAWRFRAAPSDRRIISYGQLESAWPVPGSVLVHDGMVYCAAGRSSYLDGGVRLCRLEARTGRLLSETVLDDRDPQTGRQRKEVVRGTSMPGALPDVLSCDGQSLFIRHRRFDLEGKPLEPNVAHLFSAAGFLSDQWWHRTYWMIGTMMGTAYGGWPNPGNAVPAGRLLVCDDQRIYGFGRNQYIHHGAHVGIDGATVFHFKPDQDADRRFTHYQAFALDRSDSDPQSAGPAAARRKPSRPKSYRWTQELPILVRGMVLAGDRLFMAGPPDIFIASDPHAAWGGGEGGKLLAASASDGRLLAEQPLDSPPVFDGLIAAQGRLYLATTDGSVISFAGR